MKKERRKHSQEFKREAVAWVVEQGYSCAAAERSLGVNGVLSSYGRECKKLRSKWENYLPHKRCFCLRWDAQPL